jgi:hypothetical protein
MTGHLAEWLTYLPEELQADPAIIKRAGLWLKRTVLEATSEAKEANFCPYSHAACVLRQISFVATDESAPLVSATDE